MVSGMSVRLEAVETKLDRTIASVDSTSVQFGGLGLRSFGEGCAFLAKECPGHGFGLIVDPHMVMEHIFATTNGIDVLSNMQKLYKIKLSTVAEGLALSSFENPIPKYLTTPGARIIKNNESYWSKVPDWSTWDEPETGARIVLLNGLLDFRETHREAIEMQLEPGSRMANLALLSSTEVCGYIEGLTNHIDTWQKEMVLAKFGNSKAFHVNTRVANRFWTALFKPRAGVSRTLKTGNVQQMAEITFWATLRSLDAMMSIRKSNYKDDPMVASELVKFLTVNSGYEIVERLVDKVKTIEEEQREMKKVVQMNTKTATGAATKVAELKVAYDKLEKRIGVLEKKK